MPLSVKFISCVQLDCQFGFDIFYKPRHGIDRNHLFPIYSDVPGATPCHQSLNGTLCISGIYSNRAIDPDSNQLCGFSIRGGITDIGKIVVLAGVIEALKRASIISKREKSGYPKDDNTSAVMVLALHVCCIILFHCQDEGAPLCPYN